ncbi:gamma-glutamylcyclotransferase [Virgibacillus profundi]|uniref:gamma-glutamylcyclotransferase n=1 Tax=Virgibacillus profundi TaxID=2024555 RepID=UPI0013FDFC4D|nr:gamma-glutamylcyclotransferase family protein [Virgibacillus profundi]
MKAIFVYGTLRKNEKNHHYLNKAVCLYEQAWIHGKLFDTKKGYPVMKEVNGEKIYGEVYQVSDEQLATINQLEGYTEDGPNNLYERKTVTVHVDNEKKLEAITYITGKSLADSNLTIPFGDWKVYQYLKNKPLYYFAYGSCMDDDRFKLANVQHYFQSVSGKGVLDNHGFRFSRSSSDGGKADIIESPGEIIEGVVYKILVDAMDYLYEREGVFVNAYRPAVVSLQLNNSEIIEAITFIGTEKADETKPTIKYATEIIRGAEGILSDHYIEKLKQRINKLTLFS